MVVGAEPKYSPSKIMQNIKSIEERQIFTEHPRFKSSFVVANYSEMGDTLENLKMKQLPMLSKFMLKIRETRKKSI